MNVNVTETSPKSFVLVARQQLVAKYEYMMLRESHLDFTEGFFVKICKIYSFNFGTDVGCNFIYLNCHLSCLEAVGYARPCGCFICQICPDRLKQLNIIERTTGNTH